MSSLIADRTLFWWDAKQPDAPVLWDSTIQLGEQFFNEIKPVTLYRYVGPQGQLRQQGQKVLAT